MTTSDSSNWSVAQERERHYYETRAASHGEKTQVYAEFHAPFWEGILQRLHELTFVDDGYYVDVGCGPNVARATCCLRRCCELSCGFN